jgi:hypothetical protein
VSGKSDVVVTLSKTPARNAELVSHRNWRLRTNQASSVGYCGTSKQKPQFCPTHRHARDLMSPSPTHSERRSSVIDRHGFLGGRDASMNQPPSCGSRSADENWSDLLISPWGHGLAWGMVSRGAWSRVGHGLAWGMVSRGARTRRPTCIFLVTAREPLCPCALIDELSWERR